MESTLNVIMDKSLWPVNDSFELTEQDTEECLEQTMSKYFPEANYSFLKHKTDILKYFYNNEEKCLNYIETIKPNIKRKLLKQTFLEKLYDFFVSQPDIQTKNLDIIKTKNSIQLENCQSQELLYEQLNNEFKTKNIPVFLIKEKLKILSIYLFMNNYISNFYELINKNIDAKILISIYKEIDEKKRNAFRFELNFPDTLYRDLFELFILSNYSNYHRSKGMKDLLTNYYKIIIDIFCKNQQNKNTMNNDYLEETMKLPTSEINLKLQTTLTNIKTTLIQAQKLAHQQLLIMVVSYFCLVKNTLIPLFEQDNTEKESFNTPIFMNLFYSVMRVIVNHFKNMQLDLPALIGYLDCHTFINKNILNKKSKIATRIITFYDFEKAFIKIKHLSKRFDSIQNRLLNQTAVSLKLNSNKLENTVHNLLNKPTNSIKVLDKLELFPFANQHYSNTVTILISGFLSEA